jgi:hypothetical protein
MVTMQLPSPDGGELRVLQLVFVFWDLQAEDRGLRQEARRVRAVVPVRIAVNVQLVDAIVVLVVIQHQV